ncbi:hypothetical protein D030_5148B, partial [Vibrio parahaemolyticus AQ3810]
LSIQIFQSPLYSLLCRQRFKFDIDLCKTEYLLRLC